jgi:CxxC-x17-CxxC domain-containing protein
MKKIFKRKNKEVNSQFEPGMESDIVAIINKMQQQLISLEAKIDTLISRSSEKSSQRPQRFGGRGGRDNFRERSFTKAICADCATEFDLPFKPTGDRPVYCKNCFVQHKEDRGGSSKFDRHSDRPQGRENFRSSGRRPFRKRRDRAE